jgi:hypothetical protein
MEFSSTEVQDLIEECTSDLIRANNTTDKQHTMNIRAYLERCLIHGTEFTETSDIEKAGRSLGYDLTYSPDQTENLIKMGMLMHRYGEKAKALGL